MRARIRLLVVCLTGLLTAVGVAAGAQAFPRPTSFVTMVGEPGDYVVGDNAWLWRPGTSSISVQGSVTGQVTVGVSGGASGRTFQLTFAAPRGETLTRGTYVDAERTAFRSTGRPGIDIYGEGRGCNMTTGRFTVLDVAPDLSRLWLVYEQHCEGATPALFGEVRYNQPGGDAELLVAPGRVAWPATYPHRSGRVVPVTLVNTGAEPVTVLDAAVTDGDADFSVEGTTCQVIAAGSSCAVYVGFAPAQPGPRIGVLTIRDSTSAGIHRVVLSGDGIDGRTSWQMSSEPGDPIGEGRTYAFTPAEHVFTIEGDPSHVSLGLNPHVSWGSGTERWYADFQADEGRALLPGSTFTQASRYPADRSVPSMRVAGNRYCSTVTGTFTVLDAAYDESGAVTKFEVSFEQHCDGQTPALTGTIAWHAEPLDREPPAAVTDLNAVAGPDGIDLSWVDPGDEDWSDTVVRVARGSAAPGTVTAGAGLYHGRRANASLTEPTPGTAYSFSVFPTDSHGNVGAPASITVPGSLLTMSPSRSSLTAGETTQIAGKLLDAATKQALPGEEVQVLFRTHGTSAWHVLTTVQAGADGSYAVNSRPTATTDYKVSYAGAEDRLAGASKPVTVLVGSRVTLSTDRLRAARGARFSFATHVSPAARDHPVALQRREASGWRTVATKRLSASSATTFWVRPSRAGSFTYRVRKAADATHITSTSRSITIRVR